MIGTATRLQTKSPVVFTSIDARLMENEGPNMDGERKMTVREFDALLPRLGRMSFDTVMIARSVLVEGQRPAEAAKQFGTSRQRVHSILNRVQKSAGEIPKSWKRVDVWLPPEWAAQVEEWASRALADHALADHALGDHVLAKRAEAERAQDEPAEADRPEGDHPETVSGSSGASA